MKDVERFKALSITVPPQIGRQLESLCKREARSRSEVVRDALRLYFSARSGKPAPFPLVMPSEAEERQQAEFGAFTEWASDLDRAYDVLAEK
jgi:Arc/MetJ-type ribon-helix-helix transcriptional regulator